MDMTDDNDILLKQFFQEASQQQIADKLGTNRTYIAALERGRKNITFATLAKYAAACGKKVALL